MREKDRSKERKYLIGFYPDVVRLTERYQYEAQRFDAGNENKIVAYYTISMGAIPYTDRWLIPEEEREDLTNQYDEKECGISAVEIKMFAVAKEYQDAFFTFEGKVYNNVFTINRVENSL